VSALTFSPDSRTAVSGGNDGVAIVWNPKTGEALDRLTGHVAAIHDVAFSGDGRTLYTSSLDGTILQWDVGGHRRFGRSFGVGTWPATSFVSPPFAISRDGSRFAALAGSAAVGIYSTTSLRRTTSVSLAAGRHVTAVAWAGDELVVGDDRGGVGVYSAGGSTRLLYGLAGVRRPVVAVAAHGSTVAAVGVSPPVATLAIWSGRRLVRTLQVNGLRHAPGGDLAFSPDGTLLAAAVRNGPVLLVDPRSGRVARTIVPSPSDTAISVAFSPDGSLLATASWASIATLWDSRTGRQVGRRFLVAAGGAGSIAFDPTGRMLATTGDAVRLWSVSTQQQLGSAFPGPPTQWTRVAFTPDGRYLFAVPAGGAASRWPVQPAAWAAHACAVAGRNFTREEWSRFVGGRAYTRVCPHP
jgi:WD40 repeat protein